MKNKYFVHDTSIIDEGVKIGNNTKIWHWSHVSENAEIGENCTIGQNVFIGKGVKIGNNCKIQNNVSVFQNVTLQDNVFCGPSMVFTNVINQIGWISAFGERIDLPLNGNGEYLCKEQKLKYILFGDVLKSETM